MGLKTIDYRGIERDASDVVAADRLIDMKKTHGVWDVIEECFNIWTSRNPRKWDSHLINIQDLRESRKDSKFASTTDKVTGGTLRYTLDIPEPVMYMIRVLYNPDELPMDRKFFLKWAKRFPKTMIAQKV